MPRRERGKTAAGFHDQLLQRLRNHARSAGVAPQRLQQEVAFERLLARLPVDGRWVLKGGFALQLRYGAHTRLTRDIDLRIDDAPHRALRTLRELIAAQTIADGFSFELADQGEEMQGAPAGTLRIAVKASVAGRELTAFHIDLSAGDALIGTPDLLHGSNLLDFAGIAPLQFPAYPVVQHVAEKLHAYTLPRAQENTRVKDLIDLLLFAATERIGASRLRASLDATFAARASHDLPRTLPEPPDSWARPYAALAAESLQAAVLEMRAGFRSAAAFWNPFLAGHVSDRMWLPETREWNVLVS